MCAAGIRPERHGLALKVHIVDLKPDDVGPAPARKQQRGEQRREVGKCEVGLQWTVIDLVLLDADPLADIWNVTKILTVLADGRYYDRAVLDRLLTQTDRAATSR